ncbi:hypothetical protein CJF30_00004978 [Rutstroemia sp. NJR-2017a BBW]|nr:hypothetical protein CJF30_00004978 [Rutstroemia sp. NJR-2017a BBW]
MAAASRRAFNLGCRAIGSKLDQNCLGSLCGPHSACSKESIPSLRSKAQSVFGYQFDSPIVIPTPG